MEKYAIVIRLVSIDAMPSGRTSRSRLRNLMCRFLSSGNEPMTSASTADDDDGGEVELASDEAIFSLKLI